MRDNGVNHQQIQKLTKWQVPVGELCRFCATRCFAPCRNETQTESCASYRSAQPANER